MRWGGQRESSNIEDRRSMGPARAGVGLRGRHALLGSSDLLRDAEKILHVMTDFVRNDIGLGKLTGRAEPLGHLVEKGKIQIDLIVTGAVKGPDC